MIETILFFLQYALILGFGILLSAIFCDINLNKKNLLQLLLLFLICGALQLIVYITLGEDIVWKLYPLIVHLPLLVMLCALYKKRLATALVAISTAYMCCQLPKWVGLFVGFLTGNEIANQCAHMAILVLTAIIIIRFASEYISQLFNKSIKDIVIFGIVPIVYYLFDYATTIYTNLWRANNGLAFEFLPFFLCIVFMVFCVIYYKELESKLAAKQKEQLVIMKATQQEKELSAIKKGEETIRILRHDMRHFLNTVAMAIKDEDEGKALNLIAGYLSQIDTTTVCRYCENDTLNYVLSNYAEKFKKENITLKANVTITTFPYDEIMFSSLLSNALDNAYHAQLQLPVNKRTVTILLKNANDHLLLAVQNPYHETPAFVDGLPVSKKAGHGYGTKSIRYLTEQLGGNCQFSIKDDQFIVKVIL